MSKKRKKNSSRPTVRPIPTAGGFTGEEMFLPPGWYVPVPRVCAICPTGCAHEFPLSHALHDDGSLTAQQRSDALALLGVGVPGDAHLFACCSCDWLEVLEFEGDVQEIAAGPRRNHP